MSVYYLYLNDKTEGPFTRDEVDRMLEAGKISPATLYCQPGGQWNPVATMAPQISATPPEVAVTSMSTTYNSTPPPPMVLDQLKKNANHPSDRTSSAVVGLQVLDQLRKNTNYPQARECVIFLVTVAKGLNLLFLVLAVIGVLITILALGNVLDDAQKGKGGLLGSIVCFCFWLIGLRLVKAIDQFLQMGIDAVDALVHMAGHPQPWKKNIGN